MTKGTNQATEHLTDSVLIGILDDELSPLERTRAEEHLSSCDPCKSRYEAFRSVSDRLDCAAEAIVPQCSLFEREALARKLDERQAKATALPYGGRKVLARFGWGMAIAATLAIGVLFAPGRFQPSAGPLPLSTRHVMETLEVNGETFVALPYSNPNLPINTSHIVQMQVPVSSLAEAGVVFEAVSMEGTALDHSVLADVLVGMDGQPLGVHVLSAE